MKHTPDFKEPVPEVSKEGQKIIDDAAHAEGVAVPRTVSRAAGDPEAAPTASIATDWSKVPVDTYWFSKAWGRSPLPDEQHLWEFELAFFDMNNQPGRLFAKVDGKYEEALAKAHLRFDEELSDPRGTPFKNGARPRKIMVLSS